MTTESSPEFKFFLYSDPEEAKNPVNKRLVRVHVARNSHAKTRDARTKTTKTYQARGEEECLQAQARDNKSGGQLTGRSWALSPSIPCGPCSSPYPPGVMNFESSLWPPAHTSPLAWLPSAGPARDLVQELSAEEQVLLDHYVTVQVQHWRSKYEHVHPDLDVPAFRHGVTTQLVPLCLTDAGLIQALLLVSSQVFANLYHSCGNEGQGRKLEQRALYHRCNLLRDMAGTMPQDTRDVTDAIITKGVILAFDTYLAGNIKEAVGHLEACNYMIEMKGGLETLGLNGFLATLVKWTREELHAAMNDTFFESV